MKQLPLWFFLAVCIGAGPSIAHATGMRCGTKLVSDGDSTFRVRSTCGAPHAMDRVTEYRTVQSWVASPCVQVQGRVRCGFVVERTVPVTLDVWTYDFGPHQFVRYLTFEQGRLVRLDTGGYGSSR